MNFKIRNFRKELEQQEAELLRALLSGMPVPDGIDPVKASIAGDSLLNKRLRAIIRHDPSLQTMSELHPTFRQYCLTYPGVPEAGCHTDAKQFKRWLNRPGVCI